MRHSARLLILGMLLVGAVGVAGTGEAVYARLAYTALAVGGAAAAWAYVSVRGLSVKRNARTLRASVGDTFEENFEISNRGRLLRLWIEVANESPLPGAAGSRLLTWMRPHERRKYVARTWLLRRGAYALGPTTLASGDPFGLFRVEKRLAASNSLIVLPLLVTIPAFPSPAGLLPGGKAIRSKSFDITPHAAGVREYASGDPMKRIHWPSTARRGRLMVKEFEQDPQAEIWLFLDSQQSVQCELPFAPPEVTADWYFRKRPPVALPPASLEYSVCIAASLAHYFIEQRRAVGLVSAGRVLTAISAERSERQENKILETLAFMDGRGELSLAGLLSIQVQQLPVGSSVILITPATSLDLVASVDDLQRRNLHPIVVLLRADSFGGPPGSEQLAQALAERAMPVCEISCGQDLSAALSTFSSGFSMEDNRRWQTPPSSLWT